MRSCIRGGGLRTSLSHSIDVDLSSYGERFSCSNRTQPHSVLLAEGSEVTVRSGMRIDKRTDVRTEDGMKLFLYLI